ncbi:MAG: archaeal heat shock protein Hsp20 [Nitrososphaeria archaeon]
MGIRKMSWNKRKKKKWFDVFDEFDDKFDELVDEMFKHFDTIEMDQEPEGKRKPGPYIYGFSITIGSDGRPEVREFGNVRRTGHGRVLSEVREPLVDVIDRGKEVVILAEVPGVKREDVHLGVGRNEIRLSVDSRDAKYEKIISVPPRADANSMQVQCNNGILEIRLKKK